MSTGRLRSKGVVRKCSSICVKAGEHRAEMRRADGDHRRQADRGIHRIAAADPVPETEHVVAIDAEFRHLLGVGRNGDEVLGDGALVAELAKLHARAAWALVTVSSVVNVFDETMNSVSAGSRSCVASTKSVASTFETKRNLRSRWL